MRNKKAFTIIELIAVLVILAILALIVTPIVMSIINKAKTSANKRSIDAYGRSIELAIASHMLDTGEIPTSIDELTIEYSGDEVVCETQEINSDSSIYLAGCTVGGKSVEGYTYGKSSNSESENKTYEAYEIGDEVTYKNESYYVIKASGTDEQTVKLLKAEPLTIDEVNTYGNGHINRYTKDSIGTAENENGYGGIAYYSSETCGYVNNNWVNSGCTTDYEQSDVKYVIDAWMEDKALNEVQEARIITIDELKNDLGYGSSYNADDEVSDSVPLFIGINNCPQWTMSQYESSSYENWCIQSGAGAPRLSFGRVSGYENYVGYQIAIFSIRPVIILDKSALN